MNRWRPRTGTKILCSVLVDIVLTKLDEDRLVSILKALWHWSCGVGLIPTTPLLQHFQLVVHDTQYPVGGIRHKHFVFDNTKKSMNELGALWVAV